MKSSKEKKTPITFSEEELLLLKGGSTPPLLFARKGVWDLTSGTIPPHD